MFNAVYSPPDDVVQPEPAVEPTVAPVAEAPAEQQTPPAE